MSGYTIKIKTKSKSSYTYVPYSIYFDFDSIFQKLNIKGTLDKNSIKIKRVDNVFVHYNLSDDFNYSNKGNINFLIDDTNYNEYLLIFDIKENHLYKQRDYIGLVGNGDCLKSNNENPLPLYNGMAGNARLLDIDNDGQKELITCQYYSHISSRPWHTIKVHKNTGTQEEAIWGSDIPLRTLKDGKIILVSGATSFYFADINKNGSLDLLTTGYGGYEGQNKIYIHFNNGKIDGSGYPLYEYGGYIELENCTYITTLIYEDIFNKGKKGFLIGRTYPITYINRDDELWFEMSEEEKASIPWPRWYMKSTIEYYNVTTTKNHIPIIDKPINIIDENDRPLEQYTHAGFDVLFNQKTKLFDMIYARNNGDISGDGKKSITNPVFMRNCGNYKFKTKKIYSDIELHRTMFFTIEKAKEYNGLILSLNGRFVYYPLESSINNIPTYRYKGFIKQKNPYVNSFNGFTKAEFIDWDNDGDIDIVTGNEVGHTMKIENIGTRKKPIFNDCELFYYKGKPLLNLNGSINTQFSFGESTIGQTTAYYLDITGNKILDLLVRIDNKLLLYENKGSNIKPTLMPPMELFTIGGNKFGSTRNHMFIGNFTNLETLDIINTSKNKNYLYLYKGLKNDSKNQSFLDGEPLKYDDGTNIDFSQYKYTINITVGDWDNNGFNDIFINTSHHIFYLKNVGSKEQPLFNKPVVLKDNNKDFKIGLHISMPTPIDWDNTGKLDLIISGESGMYYFYRRNYLLSKHNEISYKILYK